MKLKVLFSEDPAFVITKADKFLSSEPVLHNLILSILHSRLAQGDPGRYWMALHREETVGVVVQSPLEYPATLTPMGPRAVTVLVDAIAEAGVTLPGVNGTRRRQPASLGNGVNNVTRQPHRSRERVSTNSWNWEKFPAPKVAYDKQTREIAV